MEISYEWMHSNFLTTNENFIELIQDCSQLYSTQYGKWSLKSPYKPGENIRLSSAKIRDWLDNENTAIYWAKDGSMLVGYAIAIQLDIPKYGIISWVTQLVVHEDYRNQDIAKNLLHSIWGFTDNYAWGIVSANPYAIRALEKTTRRRSDPLRIKHNLRKIISIGFENLTYIDEKTEYFVNNEVSRINTEFYVDHSNLDEMISNVVTDTVPWTLGSIEEGWEWLAFTFKDQLPFELSEDEIKIMLRASDSVVHNAYKRMDISENHRWAVNTDAEADFILRECNLDVGDSIIDFGCGHGRHAIKLAKRGVSVTGIDYVEKNIDIANEQKREQQLDNVDFILGDCRDVNVKKVKAAICIYDVIGSYADNADNQKILYNIANHLEAGGIAIISVMNLEATEAQAKYRFTLKDNPNMLLSLRPSNIMETSGNIFDPNYYLVDTDTGIIYRREQFKRGRSLPVELIVRDKRFTLIEIEQMCRNAGFEILFSRYVNSQNWETGFEPTHVSSKEILLKCKKM